MHSISDRSYPESKIAILENTVKGCLFKLPDFSDFYGILLSFLGLSSYTNFTFLFCSPVTPVVAEVQPPSRYTDIDKIDRRGNSNVGMMINANMEKMMRMITEQLSQ